MSRRAFSNTSFIGRIAAAFNEGVHALVKNDLAAEILAALEPVDERSRPNLTPLRLSMREVNLLALNIKSQGYDLARALADELPPRNGLKPQFIGLPCKPSTQVDMESDWAAYWLNELGSPVIFHRKLWEFAYLLQALYDSNAMHPGARGLGFGCGQEPISSYLAARGVRTVVTDLEPKDMVNQGWMETGQHTGSLDSAFHAHLVSREAFQAMVSHRFVDMNAIPADLQDFDFCWSICALEHLGSIQHGLDFIINAMATLKPGGVAVHTTEFNYLDDERTIDSWPTVLFQRAHFEQLGQKLTALGHRVAPFDFNTGSKPLDRFIDVPPYAHDWSEALRRHFGGDSVHLKLSIDGFASTCFGIIVTKGG